MENLLSVLMTGAVFGVLFAVTLLGLMMVFRRKTATMRNGVMFQRVKSAGTA